MFELVKGWNLLKGQDDWEEYRKQFAENQGWATDQVAWGAGPVKFPAMVVSYAPMYAKVVSCYFYDDEARKLLSAATGVPLRPLKGWPPPQTLDGPQPERIVERVNTVGPNQGETNKHVAATLLSVVQVLLDKRLITAEAFEAKMQANLAAVDGFKTEHQATIASLVDPTHMLGGLLPEPDTEG